MEVNSTNPPKKQFWRTDPILLFAEKCSDTLGADEHNQTGILTSASNLTPAFPNQLMVFSGWLMKKTRFAFRPINDQPSTINFFGGNGSL
jgi:hypothetical protein